MKHSERSRIEAQLLHMHGHSVRQICLDTGRAKSFVQRWVSRPAVERRDGSGRPLKLTRSALTGITQRMRMKKRRSTRKIAEQMRFSQSTVMKGTQLIGLHPYHQQATPLLSRKQRAARFAFAKNNPDKDWTNVLFIDEKKIAMYQHPNKKNDVIWAFPGDALPIVPRVSHPFSLNVAAGIADSGKTSIYIFKENMTADSFRSILCNTHLSAAKRLFPGPWELYMDSDPKHTAKKITSFLNAQGIHLTNPPSMSPDLNPMENVWSMLDDNLKDLPKSNESSLRKSIRRAWDKIEQTKIQNAIRSMPTRLLLVKKSKASHINY